MINSFAATCRNTLKRKNVIRSNLNGVYCVLFVRTCVFAGKRTMQLQTKLHDSRIQVNDVNEFIFLLLLEFKYIFMFHVLWE